MDVNEPTTGYAVLGPSAVPENSVPGTFIDDIIAIDPDFNQTHTFQLVGVAPGVMWVASRSTFVGQNGSLQVSYLHGLWHLSFSHLCFCYECCMTLIKLDGRAMHVILHLALSTSFIFKCCFQPWTWPWLRRILCHENLRVEDAQLDAEKCIPGNKPYGSKNMLQTFKTVLYSMTGQGHLCSHFLFLYSPEIECTDSLDSILAGPHCLVNKKFQKIRICPSEKNLMK